MVSEQSRSMALDNRLAIQSIVSEFQHEFQQSLNQIFSEQLALLDQKLEEIRAKNRRCFREEVCNTVSQTVLHTPAPKPCGNPQFEIESGGFTLNGEEAVHTPDLSHGNINDTASIGNEEGSHEQVFDFTTETKSVPDHSGVVNTIGEGGEEKGIRELTGSEGTTEVISSSEGFESVKTQSADGPDSVFFNFGPKPEPKPPDGNSPPPSFGSSTDSIIFSSSIEDGFGIWTGSSTPNSSIIRKEVTDCDQVQPNPSMGREIAQGSQSPLASGIRRRLPLAFHQNPHTLNGQAFDHRGSDSRGVYNAGYGDSRTRKGKKDRSRVGKVGEIIGRTNRVIPCVGIVGPRLKKRSQSIGVQVTTNLVRENVRTLNFRMKFSPPTDKTDDGVNQNPTTNVSRLPNRYPKSSLNSTTSNFVIRTNLDPKLASNSKPCLKLQNQLLQSFNTAILLFPWPILSLIYADQLSSTSSFPDLLSYQLTQNCKNILKWPCVSLVDKVAWQKDQYEGFRVWALDLFSISSSKFEYGPSMKPANKSGSLFWECFVAMCFLSSIDISGSRLWAVKHILMGEATIVSKQLLRGPEPVVLADPVERRSILHEYFKLFHEDYKDYKVYFKLTHHGLPLKILDKQQAHLREAQQKQKGGVCTTETDGGCYGAFSRRQSQKGNGQLSMHKLVMKLLSKRGVLCVEFDKKAENGDLEAEFSNFKTIQDEKEVIIVKNREGIGVGHEFKIKKTRYLLDLKEDGEDKVWFWSSIYHSNQGTLDEFTSWQNYGMGRLAENHWTTTLVSKDRGDRKLTCTGSTSMALGRRDIVTGLLKFLYFFYPP